MPRGIYDRKKRVTGRDVQKSIDRLEKAVETRVAVAEGSIAPKRGRKPKTAMACSFCDGIDTTKQRVVICACVGCILERLK